MPLTHPSPTTWTLRLKSGKTTIFLYVEPLSSFTAIKTELLHVLRTTATPPAAPPVLFNGNPIPDTPDDVLLARPVDPENLHRGWLSIDREDDSADGDDDDDDNDIDDDIFGDKEAGPATPKPKQKAVFPKPKPAAAGPLRSAATKQSASASASSSKQKQEASKDCPLGAGLRDMSTLAFRFRDAPLAPDPEPAAPGLGFDEGYMDEEQHAMMEQNRNVGEKGWGVVVPVFDDIYGVGELTVPDDELDLTPRAGRFAEYDDDVDEADEEE